MLWQPFSAILLYFNANEVSFFLVYYTQMSKMSGGFLALQAKKSKERLKVRSNIQWMHMKKY